MRSMTGFGRSVTTTSLGTLTVEMKTVNHRHCQVTMRLPPEFSEFESRASALVKEWVSRGQVTVSVQFQPGEKTPTLDIQLNLPVARAYVEGVRRLQEEFAFERGLSLEVLLTLPGVIQANRPPLDEEERWHLLEIGLRAAWGDVERMRRAEGDALRDEMTRRLKTVRTLCDQIAATLPDLISYYRERLARRLQELLRDGYEVDETRLVMEASLLADRADVSEELARLESHCRQFAVCLDAEEPVGRQMDFLLQEMNREVNTIGSKAPHGEVVALCIALKAEVEKLREQTQNVE